MAKTGTPAEQALWQQAGPQGSLPHAPPPPLFAREPPAAEGDQQQVAVAGQLRSCFGAPLQPGWPGLSVSANPAVCLGSEVLSWPAPGSTEAQSSPDGDGSMSAKHEPAQAPQPPGIGAAASQQLWGSGHLRRDSGAMPDAAQQLGPDWSIPAAYANRPPPPLFLPPKEPCFLGDSTRSPLQQPHQEQGEPCGVASGSSITKGEVTAGFGGLDILHRWRTQLADFEQAAGHEPSTAGNTGKEDSANAQPLQVTLEDWTLEHVQVASSASQAAGEPFFLSGLSLLKL